MKRLLARLAEVVPTRPWLVVAVVAVAVAVTVPGLFRLQVDGDVARMLPQRSEASAGLALALQGFAGADTVYGLIELPVGRAPDPDGLADAAEAVADGLRSDPAVAVVRTAPVRDINSIDPTWLFSVADDDVLEDLRGRTAPEGLAERAGRLKALLSGPGSGELRQQLLGDPLGLAELLGDHVARRLPRADSGGRGFVAPDGLAALLVIEPAADLPPDQRVRALGRLAEDGNAALATGPESTRRARLRLTGSWAHADSISGATRRDATRLSLASVFAVLLLYLLFYRSVHSLGLVFGVLTASATTTLGLAGLVLGELTPLAAGCVAILFGLGIDPALHLVSRYREARLHDDVGPAGSQAIRGVGPAVVVATLSTALALFAMALIDRQALGQMGLVAGVGVLINGVLMLTLLPALWTLVGERIRPDQGVGAPTARALARLLQRRGGVVISGAALLFGLALAALFVPGGPGLTYDGSLSGFQPSHLAPVQVDEALRRHFGESEDKVLVLLAGQDDEALLQASDDWAARLVGLEDAAAVEGLAALLPSAARARARVDRVAAAVDLAAVADGLEAALRDVGFDPRAFAGGLERLRAPVEPRPGFVSLDEPPVWMADSVARHALQAGGQRRLLLRVHPRGDAVALARSLRAVAPAPVDGVESWVTGLPLVEAEATEGLARSLPKLVLAAVLLLAIVLLLHYRRPRVAALAFSPLLLAVLLFLALHGLVGAPLTLFALASLPLLVGIGIDDHLFVLDRYLEGGEPGSLSDTLAGAGRAVLVTTLTTLAAFGVLAMSEFEALAGFGRAVVLALVLAFLSSVVVLPALLARWLPSSSSRGLADPPGGRSPSDQSKGSR